MDTPLHRWLELIALEVQSERGLPGVHHHIGVVPAHLANWGWEGRKHLRRSLPNHHACNSRWGWTRKTRRESVGFHHREHFPIRRPTWLRHAREASLLDARCI